MRVNGTLYFVIGDNLGSAVLTLNSSGTIVGQERYFAFGSVRFASGTMQTDRLYTGQRNVASLGLLDYHARFYDPYLNRFISPDSIIPSYANPQSLDRYSYVLNSPIGFSDPSGMKPCWATARYSCNLKKVTKNQADAIVAQYKPSDQAAVVSFFQSQGVPVSNLIAKNSEREPAILPTANYGSSPISSVTLQVLGSVGSGLVPTNWVPQFEVVPTAPTPYGTPLAPFTPVLAQSTPPITMTPMPLSTQTPSPTSTMYTSTPPNAFDNDVLSHIGPLCNLSLARCDPELGTNILEEQMQEVWHNPDLHVSGLMLLGGGGHGVPMDEFR